MTLTNYSGQGYTFNAPVTLQGDPTVNLHAAPKQYVDAKVATSYSATIGDGSSTSIVVTHGLNTNDVDVSIFELTGNKRKVDSGVEIRNTSTTQVTLVFSSAPSLNSLRVNVYSNGGYNSTDFVTGLGSTEVSVTTTANLTISRMHVCSGTSADYTVTLPAASGNAGKCIGIRMDPALTKLVTVDANSTELIDGFQTRIMWANEVAILLCDGAGWSKIAGKTIPMISKLTAGSNQTFAAVTSTKINFTTSSVLTGPAAFQDAVNSKVVVKRPGQYEVSSTLTLNNTNATANIWTMYLRKGAAAQATAVVPQTSSQYAAVTLITTETFAASDEISVDGYYNGGSYTTSVYYPDVVYDRFTVTEIPTW